MRVRRFPKKAQPFLKPVKLSRLGRKQVGATFFVRRYVDDFKAKGLKGIDLARAIVKDVESFEKVQLPEERAEKLWAKRRPWEIIKTRKVVMGPMLSDSRIMTCTDASQAIVSAFRAACFKALIARELTHTYVKVLCFAEGKWKVYKADPIGEDNPFREMLPEDFRREEGLRSRRKFADGLSLADIGIKSYADFLKYSHRLGR